MTRFVLVSLALAALPSCDTASAAATCDVVIHINATLDQRLCSDDPASCCPEGYAPIGFDREGAVICLGG